MQVVAAAIFDGSRVLLARKAPGKTHAGLWEFPGGKVEPGETPEQALAREILEELELTIAVGEQLTVVADDKIEMSVYRARVLSGVPVLRDHDRVEWLLPEQLSDRPMAALDNKVRKLL